MDLVAPHILRSKCQSRMQYGAWYMQYPPILILVEPHSLTDTHTDTDTHVFPRLEKWFSILLFRRVMAVVSVVVGAPQLSSVVNVDFQKGVRRAPTARQSDVRPNGGGPSKWIKVASSPTKGWNDASEQKSHGHFAMSALKAATRSRGCDCETLSGRRKGNNKPDPSSSVSMND